MAQYYAILTAAGEKLEVDAIAAGTSVKIKQFCIGDGNGNPVTPDKTKTALVHEVWRSTIQKYDVSDNEAIFTLYIPPTVTGVTIREIGLLTDDDVLFSVANTPDIPTISGASGAAISVTLKYNLVVSSTNCIEVYVYDEYLTPDEADKKYVKKSGDIVYGPLDIQTTNPTYKLTETDTSKSYVITVDDSDFHINEDSSDGKSVIYWDGGTLETSGKLSAYDAIIRSGAVEVSTIGRGSYASQKDNKAPIFQEIDTSSTSEFYPLFKQKYVQGQSIWCGGMLVNGDEFHIYYANSSSVTQNFTFKHDGTFIPQSYANFDARYLRTGYSYSKTESDARYVQGIQLGAMASQPTHDAYSTSMAPGGCVLTGVKSNYNDSNWEMDTIYYKPVQELINGAWRTIAG
ncbi:phage tail protein [Cronobacter muytjensii]|uniref:phage tail-collar fiber domain-containing protein n=1 Tax=Cronobacter muytjensii TaxID=413501 RepID=UPI002DBD7051|nr:phage tail protein [Cronobacter muytjensii]MEB8638660.1 phage tail protein [Cronobacter muytjensii]